MSSGFQEADFDKEICFQGKDMKVASITVITSFSQLKGALELDVPLELPRLW
jgi:hypothetical protein